MAKTSYRQRLEEQDASRKPWWNGAGARESRRGSKLRRQYRQKRAARFLEPA